MKLLMKTENIKSEILVSSDVWMKFTPKEAQLLSDIAGYGAEAFLKVFKEKLGTTYIKQHEEAIKPLFDKLYQEFKFHDAKLEAVKKLIEETKY